MDVVGDDCSTAEVREMSCLEVIGKEAIVDAFGDVCRGMMGEHFGTKGLEVDCSIEVEVTRGNSNTELVEVDATIEVVELDTSIEMLVGVDAGMVVAREKVFAVAIDVTEIGATGSNTRLVTCVRFSEK